MTTEVRRFPRRRRPLAIAAFVVVLLLFPLRRALEYAEEPSAPKDCDPLPDEPPPAPAVRVATGSDLPWSQRGGTINDASCLNRARTT
jgi:hypothetical protein